MSTVMGPNRQQTIWSGEERRIAFVSSTLDKSLEGFGQFVARYGLALIFVWIGLLKFTSYEATNIEPMVMNSPVLSWIYQSLGMDDLSRMIGCIEILIGVLIATRGFAPRLSAVGSIGASLTFVITLSFMFTTPGVWEPGYGFPSLSALPGQFLAKDLVLLGVSIWTAGEALRADRIRNAWLRAESHLGYD
ncbi:MAG: YkgB family protein [Panacagrimonas sp.]